MKILKTTTALLFATAAFLASAQPIQVATGGKTGTYATLLKQMNDTCSTSTPLVEINTSGSPEALDKLMNNEVSLAFVQTDVLHLRARTEDLGNIKTLIALHPEAVHIVGNTAKPLKTGGVAGFGGTSTVITEFGQLAGQKVAAAGGSAVTAQVLRLQSEVPFNVVTAETNDAALAMLAAGQVQAVVLVGGAPLGTVTKLAAPFNLIAIAPPTVEKLKGVYRPARLTYRGLNAAGVPTVATDAVLATRDYRTAKMVNTLQGFRSCVFKNLDDLKERTGTHPAWQHISTDNKGKWTWYDAK